jgi:hypothetical protein
MGTLLESEFIDFCYITRQLLVQNQILLLYYVSDYIYLNLNTIKPLWNELLTIPYTLCTLRLLKDIIVYVKKINTKVDKK